MSVNSVTLLGNLGQTPEFKQMDNGKAVCNFSVATKDVWTDQTGKKNEKTTWHKIQAWGKLAGITSQFLKKGSKVYLEGKISNRSYEDENGQKKYVTEIIAKNIQFLDAKENSGQSQNNSGQNYNTEKHSTSQKTYTSEDIPF